MYFATEDSARDYLEQIRWPEGTVCPHCGAKDGRKLNPRPESPTHARKGLHQCGGCRRQFSVTVGTLFEDAHTPLHKWLKAIYLMCASGKGVSAAQLKRDLDLGSYRTAWSMRHRIRWALQKGPNPVGLPWDRVVESLLKVRPEARDRIRGERIIGAKMERRH